MLIKNCRLEYFILTWKDKLMVEDFSKNMQILILYNSFSNKNIDHYTKEQKDDVIDYYYLANESDTKLAGIVSSKMNIFEKLPAKIDDYTLFAINAYLNDEISIVRPCHEPMKVPDCPDICGIVASGTIIHYYI